MIRHLLEQLNVFNLYRCNELNKMFKCSAFKYEYVYERLCNYSVWKNNYNAEETFLVTLFEFEIKWIDRCCVCSIHPWNSVHCKRIACCFCTAYVLHMDYVWNLCHIMHIMCLSTLWLCKSLFTARPKKKRDPLPSDVKEGRTIFIRWESYN